MATHEMIKQGYKEVYFLFAASAAFLASLSAIALASLHDE